MSADHPEAGDHRGSARAPLAAEIELEYENFQVFLKEFSGNISSSGMFIKGNRPAAVGTLVRFAVKLKDDFRLIHGKGEVVWVRPPGDNQEHPAGMGLRFVELADPSPDLIRKIVERQRAEGGQPFDLEASRWAVPMSSEIGAGALAPGEVDLDASVLFIDYEDKSLAADPLSGTGTGPLTPRRPPAAPAPPPAAPAPPPAAKAPTGTMPKVTTIPLAVASKVTPLPAPPPKAPPPAAAAKKSPAMLVVPAAAAPAAIPAAPAAAVATPEPPAAGRTRRGMRVSPTLVVLLTLSFVAGAVTYHFLERLVNWMTGYEEQPLVNDIPTQAALQAEAVPPPPPPVSRPAVSPPVAPPPAGPTAQPAASPPAAVPAASSPATGERLNKVRMITFKEEPAGADTIVTLWGNGSLPQDDLSATELEGRILLKLHGILWPFRDDNLDVGTTSVRRIRTGHHQKPEGPELWIVLDVTDSAVKLKGIEHEAENILVRVGR